VAKKRDAGRKETKLQEKKALSRRDFFKKGAAAGVGAAVLSGEARAQGIRWNYEVDVVVLGSGCVGLHAAVRARDLGASVLILDQNFDVGGKLVHSGGWTSLGGGDAIQERDRTASDPQGLGLTAPLVKPENLEDDPDRLFGDMTDWSVVDATGVARYRYNDRELHRAWADNAPKVRQFMMDNYVRFARIDGTHQGGGMSRARAARAIMKMADKTDIKAGTLSPQDRGDLAGERHSPFNPMRYIPGGRGEPLGAPGWVWGGFAIARSLEFSAREKGVRFMLNRHMDELIREQPFSGRVLGVKASYTPRMHPETGARLESFWQNGNIDERAETIHIRAKKAVIVATGGMLSYRTSQHGWQRDHRWHENRREPRGHDAKLPTLIGLADDQQRLGNAGCGGQHLPRTPLVSLRASEGNQHWQCRMGTCHRGEPSGAKILQ
jgi:glycine/D-amino acid oxidase-like deaminating enzyme